MRPEIQSFIAYCEAQNETNASAILQAAFGDPGWSEHDLALLCAAVFNVRKHLSFPNVLAEFHRRYPSSLYPVQAYWAAICSETGDLDSATEEARHFIAKMKSMGALDNPERAPLARHFIGNALLVATAAYTELGWRSYSLRILELTKSPRLQLNESLRAYIENERGNLRTELEVPENAALDRHWEEFYHSGLHFEALHQLCTEKKLDIFAQRVDLLSSAIRFGETPVWEVEFFQNIMVAEGPNGQQLKALRDAQPTVMQ